MPASVLVGTGTICVQLGAGLAGRMFGTVSAAGMTGLRLWAAALLMMALAGRPALRSIRGIVAGRAWRDASVVAGFGVTLGVMNFCIYQSFARIPLGIAVTIEFLGPLGVAVASSRRLVDGVWIVLAGTGVAVLSGGGASLAVAGAGHAGRHGGTGVAVTGIVFALVAAAAWAVYIAASAATGRRFEGASGLVIAMALAAVMVTPAAVASGGTALLRPAALGTGLGVGLLSSVIPYRFELEALRRIRAGVFGIWMSMEPAVAALAGLVLLGERLSVIQWLAITLVIVACAGAARGAAGLPSAQPLVPPPA